MKYITKVLMIFIVLVLFLFTSFVVTASYNKPTAPSGLSTEIISAVNNILDIVYNKKNNKTKFPTDESYISYLDKVNVKLNELKNTFSSTDTRYMIVTYLSDGLTNIKSSVQNDTSFIDGLGNIVNDDTLMSGTGISTSTSTTGTASINNTGTTGVNGVSCIFKTNEMILGEKYIDTNNFVLVSGKQISAKFYLLNGDYKKLTIKCDNGVKSINTSINPVYGCKSGYSINNGVCEISTNIGTTSTIGNSQIEYVGIPNLTYTHHYQESTNRDQYYWVNNGKRYNNSPYNECGYIDMWGISDYQCSGGYSVQNSSTDNEKGLLKWECKSSDGQKVAYCYGIKDVNALCGSNNGKIVINNLFNQESSDNCKVGFYKKTKKDTTGTFYNYLIENTGSGTGNNTSFRLNANYLYTCGGINGGKDVECRTGKISINGKCGYAANRNVTPICEYGNFEYTGEVSPIDGKYNQFKCIGINGGSTATCSYGTIPTSIVGKCGKLNGGSIGIGNFNGYDSIGLNFVLNYIGGNPPSTTGTADLCDIINYGNNITGIVNITDKDGTDGTYNRECNGKKTDGTVDSSNKVSCSATRLKLGQCGTLNGGKIAGIATKSTINGVYTTTVAYSGTVMNLSSYFANGWYGDKLCIYGSSEITDNTGTDGTYNWKCIGASSGNTGYTALYNQFKTYNFIECSAEKYMGN